MKHGYLTPLLFILTGYAAVAQIGAPPALGLTDPGRSSLAPTPLLGLSDLPKCKPANACTQAVTYIFTGAGSWDIESNWEDEAIPPALLPAGAAIIIDPLPDGECRLTIPQQTIGAGALLNVLPGRRLTVVTSLLFLK